VSPEVIAAARREVTNDERRLTRWRDFEKLAAFGDTVKHDTSRAINKIESKDRCELCIIVVETKRHCSQTALVEAKDTGARHAF
jgi:hypothetical protein